MNWIEHLCEHLPVPAQNVLVMGQGLQLGLHRHGGRYPEFREAIQRRVGYRAGEMNVYRNEVLGGKLSSIYSQLARGQTLRSGGMCTT